MDIKIQNIVYFMKDNESKIIDIDYPPIVNAKGDRMHPGQDYNCRCGF